MKEVRQFPHALAPDFDFDAEFPNLSTAIENVRFQLPTSTPDQNVFELLESKHPRKEIENVPPRVLFELMCDAEWENARDLVQYLTPEQFQAIIDMDAWRNYEVDTKKLEKWFDALVDLTSDTDFVNIMRDIDSEIPALLFHANIIATPIIEDEEPFNDEVENWHLSPDGTYAIADISDEDSAALMRKLINRLAETDPVLEWTLFEAAIWELKSEMTEYAYRWRTSRMAELGFPEKSEALSIYKTVSPANLLKKWKNKKLPTKILPKYDSSLSLAFLAHVTEKLLIYQALEELNQSDNFQHLLFELITLQNCALVAAGIENSKGPEMNDVSDITIGFLNLGLEYVSENNLETAKEILMQIPLKTLFSAGYSAARAVKTQAEELRKRSVLTIIDKARFSLLNNEETTTFEGLAFNPPIAFPGIFEHVSQVDEASATVHFVAFKQLWFFTLFSSKHQSLGEFITNTDILNRPEAVTFDLFFQTANANSLIGEQDPLRPFNKDRLEILIHKIRSIAANFENWEKESTFQPFLQKVAAFPEDTVKYASKWISSTMKKLHDEISKLDTPEPKFLVDVLLLEK